MLRTGFLDWITTPEDLDARKEGIATAIAGLAPQPLRGMKQSLNEIASGLYDERAARERFAASFHTDDAIEGRKAIAAKRPPRSEEHTSGLQSLMRLSYAVFRLNTKNSKHN